MKIRLLDWFVLLLLSMFLSCGSSATDDSGNTLIELLAYSAVLNATQILPLTTNGVGTSGLLSNQQAVQRYSFTGSSVAHLMVLYGAADSSTSLDGVLDLATGAGVAVTQVDRQIQGLVERRESILTATQYLLTVRAFSGTSGTYAVAISAGTVSGGGSCVVSASNCRDYNAGTGETPARANCTAASGAFSSAVCTATNRVGRCTTGFFDTGVTSVSGYSPGFTNAILFQADCLTTFGADQFLSE